ncbi:MAG TPA: S8 family serine peptidase [Gaiellaceae bacterium]|nr:S8 family serine peptidase [Gaiellaceae bacterium]
MKRLLAVAAIALVLPGAADAARFAVGISPGADRAELSRAIEQRTGGTVKPLAPFALVLEADRAAGVLELPGVAYVERLGTRGRRMAFVPNDPFATRQWHLGAVQAFDAWALRPTLPGMRVAIVDSGIDGGHPELAGRIAEAKSFVGGSARRDLHGHGTFIAGLIAASLNNGEGIAGMAFPAQLLVAKVVRADGVVPLEAEARAIRWAVDRRARVINLSLGGVRDPLDPARDSFSPLEASAVEYAIRRGVIVVAAVGNGDNAPEQPWRWASYPAALPHVLGVSAVARDGSIPAFSNRDPFYNDLAAPGDELFSTLPRNITAERATCEDQGYSDCGPLEYRRPQGTSFAAAIASAAAVLVRASWPARSAQQTVGLMERSATDMTSETGCRRCTPGRDPVSGWGRLNVAAAVDWAGRLPANDRYETNDDAGHRAWRIRRKARGFHIVAALDYWDDPNDVYAVRLRKGGRLAVTLTGRAQADVNLILWKPGTRRVESRSSGLVARASATASTVEFVRYRARRAGIYYINVRIVQPGAGDYVLRVVRR